MQSWNILLLGLVCFGVFAVQGHPQLRYMFLAEFEPSVVCYNPYDDGRAIWNTLMKNLPVSRLEDETLLARDFSHLRAHLRANKSPCVAIEQVLNVGPDRISAKERAAFRARCGTTELFPKTFGKHPLRLDAPILTCLNAVHQVGLTAVMQTPEEEEANAANFVMASSGEAAMTYDGTYSTSYTQAVVNAALAGGKKR